MTPKQFIEKSIEGGYNVGPIEVDMVCDNKYAHYLLDPLAWAAVGKVEGWGTKHNILCNIHNGKECDHCPESRHNWKMKMHFLIDALVEGKTIEQFLETL